MKYVCYTITGREENKEIFVTRGWSILADKKGGTYVEVGESSIDLLNVPVESSIAYAIERTTGRRMPSWSWVSQDSLPDNDIARVGAAVLLHYHCDDRSEKSLEYFFDQVDDGLFWEVSGNSGVLTLDEPGEAAEIFVWEDSLVLKVAINKRGRLDCRWLGDDDDFEPDPGEENIEDVDKEVTASKGSRKLSLVKEKKTAAA